MTDLLTVEEIDTLLNKWPFTDLDQTALRRLCATARVGAGAVEVVKEEQAQAESRLEKSRDSDNELRCCRAGGQIDLCDEILRRLTALTETRGKPMVEMQLGNL